MTSCMSNRQLIFGADPMTFRVCAFLVNVLSDMYEQWKSIKPKPPVPPAPFNWQPYNPCTYTSSFKVTDFEFRPLVWSKYTWVGITFTEPFGCTVRSKINGTEYVVLRGSKTIADFCIDAEADLVAYTAPTTPAPPPGIKVEQGWYKVYNGLFDPLLDQLKTVQQGEKLIVTGHSLGSAVATLLVPDLVASYWPVQHYNLGSPMVGNDAFRTYYESLGMAGTSRGFVQETFRLVNTADLVPKFPKPRLGREYVHVGTEVSFNANYGDEEKAHNPCCSYTYAVYHPDDPCNEYFDRCNGVPT